MDAGSDGSSDSFVDDLLEADGERLDSAPAEKTPASGKDEGDEQDDSAADPQEEDTPAVEAQEPDQRLKDLATEMGLDPANPRDRELLEKMAAKLAPDEKPQDEAPETELTEYEKSLLKPKEAGAPETKPATTPETPQAKVQPRIGDDWQRAEDAYKALQEAYGNGDDQPTDLSKVVAIEHEMFDRRFEARALPAVEKAVERMLKERLAPMLPAIERLQQKEANERNYDFAVTELSKLKGFEDLPKLYEPVDGNKLHFGGKAWPNNPINQVYAKYPELLKIQVKHEDPEAAARLSNMERLRAVVKHWREMSASKAANGKTIPATAAKDLVKAGAEQQKREAANRTRQALNSGRGASGAGTKPKSPDDEWFDGMNRSAGGTLSDLFK